MSSCCGTTFKFNAWLIRNNPAAKAPELQPARLLLWRQLPAGTQVTAAALLHQSITMCCSLLLLLHSLTQKHTYALLEGNLTVMHQRKRSSASCV
jgi:hypothetical protein